MSAPSGTYWVVPGRLLAGGYPAGKSLESTVAKLEALNALGVNYFIDLTMPGERTPYEPLLPHPYDTITQPVYYSRRPITDHGLPERPLQMVEILDEIDEALAAGHCLYVHCRAGVGRTGLVIGCYLARGLGSGSAALERLDELWVASDRHLEFPHSPETDEQTDYVRRWPAFDRPITTVAPPRLTVVAGSPRDLNGSNPDHELADDLADEIVAVAERMQDRYRGAWLGLALGDALAQPVQNRRPGSFTPVGDLIGGGPHQLPAGAWTDDTAVPLALADGLLAGHPLSPNELIQRLRAWQTRGDYAATGQCLGISAATARALAQAQWSGKPFAGSHDPERDEQEPLVRAVAAVCYALPDWDRAVSIAVDLARLTHQAPVVLDGVRYVAGLLFGALRGVERDTLLAGPFEPVRGAWQQQPLRPEIASLVAAGPPAAPPASGGRTVDALAALLHALGHGQSYRDTVLRAANLGGEADATAALTGVIAGALYGASAQPAGWQAALARRELVLGTADRLLAAAIEGSGT